VESATSLITPAPVGRWWCRWPAPIDYNKSYVKVGANGSGLWLDGRMAKNLAAWKPNISDATLTAMYHFVGLFHEAVPGKID
jgi:hypothetical protein